MNFRSPGRKTITVAMAASVLCAEVASMAYYSLVPWFLEPGQRSTYASLGSNSLLFVLLNMIVNKVWPLRKTKDVAEMSVAVTLIYAAIYAPYAITWYNPLSYIYTIGPVVHTFVQIVSMVGTMLYFAHKK
ncbi:uncharacterized protein LOC127862066 [Dreissena polymorpha]|uniref:Uncharacterized protein n=1 Tax=Dreissena polymorpha TaxID=45954 RepID=A0A9D3YC49_DREPO|nr:uncharacterized protein LOC127862066 [Dreissena polymorpha]KAH3695819.1 hypothetical protein DPMN_083278 [Dreissena polymorpha]